MKRFPVRWEPEISRAVTGPRPRCAQVAHGLGLSRRIRHVTLRVRPRPSGDEAIVAWREGREARLAPARDRPRQLPHRERAPRARQVRIGAGDMPRRRYSDRARARRSSTSSRTSPTRCATASTRTTCRVAAGRRSTRCGTCGSTGACRAAASPPCSSASAGRRSATRSAARGARTRARAACSTACGAPSACRSATCSRRSKSSLDSRGRAA